MNVIPCPNCGSLGLGVKVVKGKNKLYCSSCDITDWSINKIDKVLCVLCDDVSHAKTKKMLKDIKAPLLELKEFCLHQGFDWGRALEDKSVQTALDIIDRYLQEIDSETKTIHS